ncbi:LysM peptidoglycan-binding domain-containing protein [Herbiconiux sp. CPCC 203407]|uniref:LysM peptidoglycan-binding domain-containing protein n=1 Tax=Herbiconiux oxytropis TaxID=2970915 RepID=A0AA42BU81_9MICO|nr:LysM domain-containing protein [Herbiconiux oxytropis]MCS5722338.1 LysM peptidoglycan-binding domain-containing protein [Herbiconiux oxytropis]MCS5727265.1 LysM peptidoglycan-binding domain-containing protein [Herbiconiux oxytropis]
MVAARLGRLRAAALGGLVTASALVLLGACTSGSAPADDPGAAPTSPSASASEPVDPAAGTDADAPDAAGDAAVAAASWVPEPLPGNAVLATGTFESPDAAVTGNIAIVTDAVRVVEIVLTDFALDPEVAAGAAPQMTLLSEPIGEFGCYDTDGYSFQPSPLTGDVEQRMTMGPVDDVPTGDPSFLDQAVIYLPVEAESPPSDGCYGDTVAIADLEWLTPQDLPELADSGIRSGATGEVGTDADDALSVYVVAEGDSLGRIASRFGVSTEAVLYLNAGRIGQDGLLEDGTVYAGEALNLSPSAR